MAGARLGVLQPSMVADNNPHEFYLMAPPGVQLVLTSLGMVERDQRAPNAATHGLDRIEDPVRRLLGRGDGPGPRRHRGSGYPKHPRSEEVMTRERCRSAFRSAARAEGVWLPGASLPTVAMIEALGGDIGAPVVTGAQAMMWEALRLAGMTTGQVSGFGRLFGT